MNDNPGSRLRKVAEEQKFEKGSFRDARLKELMYCRQKPPKGV